AVVPLRLRYRLPGGGATTAAAFIGDETLLDSLRRILPQPGLRIDVTVCAAIHPDRPASRRLLAHLAAASIGAHSPTTPSPATPSSAPPDPTPPAAARSGPSRGLQPLHL